MINSYLDDTYLYFYEKTLHYRIVVVFILLAAEAQKAYAASKMD